MVDHSGRSTIVLRDIRPSQCPRAGLGRGGLSNEECADREWLGISKIEYDEKDEIYPHSFVHLLACQVRVTEATMTLSKLRSLKCSPTTMYWPLGAPKVYAAARRKRKSVASENEEKDSEDVEQSILGLRVARNGHLFVTITEDSLTVWQTSVRRECWNID